MYNIIIILLLIFNAVYTFAKPENVPKEYSIIALKQLQALDVADFKNSILENKDPSGLNEYESIIATKNNPESCSYSSGASSDVDGTPNCEIVNNTARITWKQKPNTQVSENIIVNVVYKPKEMTRYSSIIEVPEDQRKTCSENASGYDGHGSITNITVDNNGVNNIQYTTNIISPGKAEVAWEQEAGTTIQEPSELTTTLNERCDDYTYDNFLDFKNTEVFDNSGNRMTDMSIFESQCIAEAKVECNQSVFITDYIIYAIKLKNLIKHNTTLNGNECSIKFEWTSVTCDEINNDNLIIYPTFNTTDIVYGILVDESTQNLGVTNIGVVSGDNCKVSSNNVIIFNNDYATITNSYFFNTPNCVFNGKTSSGATITSSTIYIMSGYAPPISYSNINPQITKNSPNTNNTLPQKFLLNAIKMQDTLSTKFIYKINDQNIINNCNGRYFVDGQGYFNVEWSLNKEECYTQYGNSSSAFYSVNPLILDPNTPFASQSLPVQVFVKYINTNYSYDKTHYITQNLGTYMQSVGATEQLPIVPPKQIIRTSDNFVSKATQSNMYLSKSCNIDELLPINTKQLNEHCSSSMRLTYAKRDDANGSNYPDTQKSFSSISSEQCKIIDKKLGGSGIPYKNSNILCENDVENSCIDDIDPNNPIYKNDGSCIANFTINGD